MNQRVPLFNQGSLDCLCGVYAIMNAFGLLAGESFKKADRQALFNHLCSVLDENDKRLFNALTFGIEAPLLCQLIDAAEVFMKERSGLVIKRRSPHRKKRIPLDEYWASLEAHLALCDQNAVIMRIGGSIEHWTCVYKITQGRIFFADSSGISYFNKLHCRTDSVSGRKNILYPAETYFLSMKC